MAVPRRRSPVLTRRVPLKEVLAALGGISEDTYRRRWQAYFTDVRSTAGLTRGSKRYVLEDELTVGVADGPAAVLLFRRTMGRV